jgi:uncharacterized protein (TIGR03663 family)
MNRSAIAFGLCIAAVAVGALAFRLPRLTMRPMHPDEANQAVRTGILYDTGVYRYDPAEHHGPSLYYLALAPLSLSGAKDFAASDEFDYRIVPAVFGVGLVLLLLLIADGIGRTAAVAAGVLTAVSSAMVFYSRYYIQEMTLVFFTFAAIVAVWRYVQIRSIAWAAAAGAAVGSPPRVPPDDSVPNCGVGAGGTGTRTFSPIGWPGNTLNVSITHCP